MPRPPRVTKGRYRRGVAALSWGMLARINHVQLMLYAGLFTWACVGIPLVLNTWYFTEGLAQWELFGWRVSYFVFGIAYVLLIRRIGKGRGHPFDIVGLLVITVTSIALSYFSGTGLGGGLLLVVAGVIPWLLPLRAGIVWLVLQYLALAPVFASRPEFNALEGLLQATFYIGYATVVFVAGLIARQQAEAREEQRRLNSELRATRALLAESSRLTERTRISRELHDLLGHHLTALSLNLEVATHLSEGRVQDHVRQAQSLAKLLLSDVREAVSQLRDDDAIDLSEALHTLVEGVPSLDVHLELPDNLAVADPARAHVLLRVAQEIITNTVRHAGARTLWLALAREDRGIAIRAHDDGRGADAVSIGNGLRGMRERLTEVGGRLEIRTAPDRGFAVDAWLPLEQAA
jgi:signal transduction histidine kinase